MKIKSLKKSRAIKGNTLIAKQALDEAIAKHGRRMADKENYPASRDVVEIDIWRSEFLKMRVDSCLAPNFSATNFGFL